MKQSTMKAIKVGGFILLVIVCAVGFTADDLTGIGELLDPLEFAASVGGGAVYYKMLLQNF